MTGYHIVNLIDIVGTKSEGRIMSDLLLYSCPLNNDVENFLKIKAIEFSKYGFSQTHLVYTSYKGSPVLCGYFTLCVKSLSVKRNAISKTLAKRFARYGTFDSHENKFLIGCPLIGQLGKNYLNGYNKLITGDELLKMACDKIQSVQRIIGGKFVYLECEDEPKLIHFYNSNGFVLFGQRQLDPDETGIKGQYLNQMIRHFKNNN